MIGKLLDFVDDMARDKKLHLVAGLLAGLVGAMLGGLNGVHVFGSGVALAAFAGVAKEVYDSVMGGVVDKRDFLYTAIGGLPTSALVAYLA